MEGSKFIFIVLLSLFVQGSIQAGTSTTTTNTPRCSFDSDFYDDGETVYQDDCLQYNCSNGIWVATGEDNPRCCSIYNVNTYRYKFDRPRIDTDDFDWWHKNENWTTAYNVDQFAPSSFGSVALGQSVYTSKCLKFTCVAKSDLRLIDEKKPECCGLYNRWYLHAQPLYKGDCYGYVCLNGTWLKTNNTDPKCCETAYSDAETTDSRVLSRTKRFNWEFLSASTFPWWFEDGGNKTWAEQYREQEQELYLQYLGLHESTFSGDCDKITCVSKNVVRRSGEFHEKCCNISGKMYHHASPLHGDDCMGYVCLDSKWLKTEHKDPRCCATRRVSGDYQFSKDYIDIEVFPWWYSNETWTNQYQASQYEKYRGYTSLNYSVYTSRCEKFVCTAKETLTITGDIHPDCCEYNSKWYHHAQPIYKDDCVASVCLGGNWYLPNQTDPYCCKYVYQSIEQESSSQSSNTEPSQTSLQSQSSNTEPSQTSLESQSSNTEPSQTSLESQSTDDQSRPSSSQSPNTDQTESSSESSTVTEISSLRRRKRDSNWEYVSPYRYPWWSLNDTLYYTYQDTKKELMKDHLEVNGASYTDECEKLVCVGRDNVDATGEIHPKCCNYNGKWYHHARPMYDDICEGYICWEGKWLKANSNDHRCCSVKGSEFEEYQFEPDDIDEDRYDWWHNNNTWTSSYYHNPWDDEFKNLPLNGTIYTNRCQKFICSDKDTVNITDEIHEDCCEYNNTWYRHFQPMYRDDCLGYICLNGNWIATNHSDPHCCGNLLEDEEIPSKLWAGIYHDRFPWWYAEFVDIDIIWREVYKESLAKYHLSGSSANAVSYTDNCEKLVCNSKDNFTRTEEILSSCCPYNGSWYFHGYPRWNESNCMAEVCNEGSWLQLEEFTEPTCCSDIYRKLEEEENAQTTDDNTPSNSEGGNSGIYFEKFGRYWHGWFGLWFDGFSWYNEYQKSIREMYNEDLGWNEFAYTGSCEKLVCLGRENVNRTEEIHPSCCPLDGKWVPHGYPISDNMCQPFVCSKGTWIQIDYVEKCCTNIYIKLENQQMEAELESKNSSAIENNPQKREARWGERNTLIGRTSTGLAEVTRSRRAIEWDPSTLVRYPWWTGDLFREHYEQWEKLYLHDLPVNGDAYTGSCEQIVCHSKQNFSLTGEFHPSCCLHDGTYYHHGYPTYKNSCSIAYYCSNGTWLELNHEDPNCCAYWDIDGFDLNEFGQEYIDYVHFFWWYEHEEWLDESANVEYSKQNGSFYNHRCQRFDCLGRGTVNFTGEIKEDCCEYKDVWYHHNIPIYQDDCLGYVCINGTWLKTNYTDPKCCEIPNFKEDKFDLSLVSTSTPYLYYNARGWQTINKKNFDADCREIKCVSRDTWIVTGDAQISKCDARQGCYFNGAYYYHSHRLEGCFQIYCVNGQWMQGGYVDDSCKMCMTYWDPHIMTFDGHYYQYHGLCEYSMAREGRLITPSYYVNTHFVPCWSRACVGPSTFKDSKNTIIKMGAFGSEIFKILVNDEPYEIADSEPRLVNDGRNDHNVFAWRSGDCIRLLGSSQLAVEKCSTSLSIWASPYFHEKLHGLCGYFDGDVENDFLRRIGGIAPLEETPDGDTFPETWQASCESGQSSGSGRIKREAQNCSLDETHRTQCKKLVEEAENIPKERTEVLIANCLFDICSIYEDTAGNSTVIEEWLGEVEVSVKQISEVEEKTTAVDVIPEAVFEDITPPDTGADHDRRKLAMQLMLKVKIGNGCQ